MVSRENEQVVLQVPGDAVNGAVTELLARFEVDDLNVEAAPLEEVMSELFAEHRESGG